MSYESKLKNVSILGAAGKMGSGILSLIAVEAARLALENNYTDYCVNAIDTSQVALLKVKHHIRELLVKYAEKNIVWLRKIYKDRKDLIENRDVIDEYANFVFEHINFSNLPVNCADSDLIFEAIIEDKKIKCDVIKSIEALNKKNAFYLTNTSSIPINELDTETNLNGRIIGFHFYNPPPVQKLVELIRTENTDKELISFANELAEKLEKQIVPSNDVAGFIGNGFFMREILLAVEESKKLSTELSDYEAMFAINKITQEYLLRPMGMFQLVDYVGLDVCSFIMKVMNPYFENEVLHTKFLDDYLNAGIRGGQLPSGFQRDGIFQYDHDDIIGYFDLSEKKYLPIENLNKSVNQFLGENQNKDISWFSLRIDRDINNTISNYFNGLFSENSTAANLSQNYLYKCRQIGEQLVNNSTAKDVDDVNMVMKLGFHHHYGPVNEYVKMEVEK